MENESNFTELEKEKLIKKEITKLKKNYKDIDKGKLETVFSLIEEAAFMIVTLKDLRKTINKKGTTTTYQNGENQWGTKKSPEVETYNTMVKNHMSIIKQLTDLLPKDVIKVEDDGFDNFVSERDD